MIYTREQLNNIRAIKATPAYQHATPLERRAVFEAAIVESNIRDLHYGDRDSTGILQQRNNGAWGHPNESVQTDVTQFLAAARRISHQYHDAGQLAQAVQVSAFPDRYDQHRGEARAIVGGASPAAKTYGVGTVTAGHAPTFAPGGQTLDKQGAVVAALLDPRKKMSLASRILENVQGGQYTTTTAPSATSGTAPKYKLGSVQAADAAASGRHAGKVATFDGKKVAGWIKPILAYARQHGWKGSVSSGFRSDAEQTRIYDSGVRPAAVPKSEGGGGSNHEGAVFPLGAVDVSEAAQLAAILHASPFAHKLQWAGSKDPVHFSHPHGGGY